MAWQPTVLQPTAPQWFVEELTRIDKDLRVVWGQERYLQDRWAIERKIPADRYAQMYASVLNGLLPRFIDQPIYDHTKPYYDEDGNEDGFEIVAWRKFDLAPEFEWVQFVQEPDGRHRPLDMRTIVDLKRIYAWNRFHSLTRARIEKQQAQEQRDKLLQEKEREAWLEALDQAWHESGKIATCKPGFISVVD